MPISHSLRLDDAFVYTRVWGRVTDSMVIATVRTLDEDSRVEPHFAQLIDGTEIEDLALTVGGLRVAALTNTFNSQSQRAVVVSSTVAFGMGRMYELIRPHAAETFHVFRSLDEACEWLGPRMPSDWDQAATWPLDYLFDEED